MTYLHHSILRMILFLGAVAVGVSFIFAPLMTAFSHNVWLNGLILSSFSMGVALIFKQLYRLFREQQWLTAYEYGEEKFPGIPQPHILSPLQTFLDHESPKRYNPLTIKALLASIETRLDESREINRYLIGLMIFLGLLGTFWGLSRTISAITHVIGGIDMGNPDIKQAFDALKLGLQSPLAGMGTAFSCSMYGLACSLVLGFLDLTIAKTQSTFFQSLENQMASLMKGGSNSFMENLSPQSLGGETYNSSLLEQTAEGMSQITHLIQHNEENRGNIVKMFQGVGEKLALLSEHMAVQQTLLQKVAQNHVDLQVQINTLTQTLIDQKNQPFDDGIKEYLRNIDITVLQLLEEIAEGRTKSVQEIRQEIRLVARTISALPEQNIAA
jgi:hypothetical protein